MFLRRKLAGIVAGVMTLACLAQLPTAMMADAEGSYSMNVTVDLTGEKKSISPLIYGVNDFGNTGNYRNTKVNAVRQGGNRYTGYNWETNWSNAGEDWINSSDTHLGDDKNGPAYAVRRLSEETADFDISYKLATLQMAGYVAADKKGEVKEGEGAPGERWYEVKAKKDGELSLEPDTTDKTVYMDEYVNYIVNKLGDASTKTGIQGYSLDNEPFLWNDTHPFIHKEECGADELIDKSIELSKVVKDIDPKAEVFGPAVWGMLPCITAGDSEKSTDPVWAEKKANYDWYVDYYLERMAKAEQETGKRLLDVFDVHFYSQDCSTDDGALQAARSLYDETYIENSWLQPTFGKYFPFLTKLQDSIKKYYPGTKLAVSEYNLANIGNEKVTGKSVVSAIAEMETLGAFADNDVYFATYWGTLPECPYVESAINLYTNYDGKGGAFGDTLVKTTSEDVSKSAAYAAIKGEDDSNVDVILSNKNKTEAEKAVITIEGSSKTYKSAVVYAVTQDHSDIRVAEVRNDVNGNTVEIELPALSVAHIVLSDKETDAKVYEAPNITVKETVYNVSDLKSDSNGNLLIPLGDKAHLKEIVFSYNCSSSEGSAYYSGGGGLGFPQLVPDGETGTKWGFKAVNFSNGTTECVVPFSDGIFAIPDDAGGSKETKCVSKDTEAQWQPDWWKFSEKGGDGGKDVTIEYTTVKLVYVYDNDTETVPSEVTTAPTTPSETTSTTVSTAGPKTKETKESVLNVSDLKKDKYDNLLIPLGDKEHLKEIVFSYTCSSSEGAANYSGGGGLGFPQLIPEGETAAKWGYKPVNFKNGTTECVVPFNDGLFMISPDGEADAVETKAVCKDTEGQWQPNWWKYSAKHADGSDVEIEYTTVKLVYEYDSDTEQVPAETTTTEPTTPSETTSTTVATTSEAVPTTEVTTTKPVPTATIPVPTVDVPDGSLIFGDVDNSGVVDLADVTMLSKFIMNSSVYAIGEKAQLQADVTHDAVIDARDLSKLIEFNLGKKSLDDLKN